MLWGRKVNEIGMEGRKGIRKGNGNRVKVLGRAGNGKGQRNGNGEGTKREMGNGKRSGL
jgi:hypothetical protein